ncbi:hypothetical protein ACETRX_20155, partial [Labrys portucalensis]
MGAYELKPVFSRGELSPKLHSRADLEHFKTGLKECQNFMVMRQGGLTRRPGTQFVQEVKDSSRPARFIPFIFSASQAYMLVFNAGVFRVYALGGRVGSVEVAHPYADADLFQLDFDQTNDVLDITHKGYQPRRVKRQSDTSWTMGSLKKPRHRDSLVRQRIGGLDAGSQGTGSAGAFYHRIAASAHS